MKSPSGMKFGPVKPRRDSRYSPPSIINYEILAVVRVINAYLLQLTTPGSGY